MRTGCNGTGGSEEVLSCAIASSGVGNVGGQVGQRGRTTDEQTRQLAQQGSFFLLVDGVSRIGTYRGHWISTAP